MPTCRSWPTSCYSLPAMVRSARAAALRPSTHVRLISTRPQFPTRMVGMRSRIMQTGRPARSSGSANPAVHSASMSRRRSGLADWRAIARLLLPDSVYRSYRRRKIAAEIAHYTPREVRHRYGRHELRVRLEDPLAEGWYDHDWREPSFITF